MSIVKNWLLVTIVVFFFFHEGSVHAGNNVTKEIYLPPENQMYPQDYIVYLIGGPTTHRRGLENLSAYLKLRLRNKHLYSSIYVIYPYADGSIENEHRISLDKDLKEHGGVEGAKEIFREMVRQNGDRAKFLEKEKIDDPHWRQRYRDHEFLHKKYCNNHECTRVECDPVCKSFLLGFTKYSHAQKAVDKMGRRSYKRMHYQDFLYSVDGVDDEERNDTYPIIIAHGLSGLSAIKAVELLPKYFGYHAKNLILIGTPRMQIPEIALSSKSAIYIYDLDDPMHNLGAWGKDLPYRDHLRLTKPEDVVLVIPQAISTWNTTQAEFSAGGNEVSRKTSEKIKVDYTTETPTLTLKNEASASIKMKAFDHIVSPKLKIKNTQGMEMIATLKTSNPEEEPDVDVNNCYFLKGPKYTDSKGNTNLEKTVNSFFDRLCLPLACGVYIDPIKRNEKYM